MMHKPDPGLVAGVILENFDKHFGLFDQITRGARQRFVSASWSEAQRSARERIKLYDLRVCETIEELRGRFAVRGADPKLWREVRCRYAAALGDHHQPELAETFYNSVFCHLFHRNYFNNQQIFIESTVTEPPQPESLNLFWHARLGDRGISHTLLELIQLLEPGLPLRQHPDLLRWLLRALRQQTGLSLTQLRQCRLTVYRELFYRNKAAYILGELVLEPEERAQRAEGDVRAERAERAEGETAPGRQSRRWPLAIPLIHHDAGELTVDALICDEDQLAIVFGFARSSFMVACPVPAQLVQFLQRLMPGKSLSDLYMALGLNKQAKNEFYRGFLQQLKESDDQLVIAPGIRGMVMSVFTLPSWPYVFKVIKDKFEPPKQWTRRQVKDKYQMVKLHDRAGRMADTLEFSDVAFPRERLSDELLEELRQVVPSQVQEEPDQVVIRHLYVERRMVPLNIFLEQADDEQRWHALDEYGKALKELAAANVFPGDMLLKNFGVTRHNRVIFYDYDEITYMTECNFRKIPQPRTLEEEMSGEPWYSVMPDDIFPEELFNFVTPRRADRELLLSLHPDLATPDFWCRTQENIQLGLFDDVIPYHRRFRLISYADRTPVSQDRHSGTESAAATGAATHGALLPPG